MGKAADLYYVRPHLIAEVDTLSNNSAAEVERALAVAKSQSLQAQDAPVLMGCYQVNLVTLGVLTFCVSLITFRWKTAYYCIRYFRKALVLSATLYHLSFVSRSLAMDPTAEILEISDIEVM